MPKLSKKRPKIYKNTIEFVWGLAKYSWNGVCPALWLIYTVRLHWRNYLFPLPAGINCRQPLGQE